MLIKRPDDIHSSEITPEGTYLNRRDFMEQAGILAAGALIGGPVLGAASPRASMNGSAVPSAKSVQSAADDKPTPFEAVTTVTVQIVTLLVGDQEFDSPKTLAAFALGLVLFVMTLTLNVIAITVVRKYREQYE